MKYNKNTLVDGKCKHLINFSKYLNRGAKKDIECLNENANKYI